MADYLKVLIPSAIGLVTTVAAAFLSARWGIRRAFEERWWGRKEQAYTEIIPLACGKRDVEQSVSRRSKR